MALFTGTKKETKTKKPPVVSSRKAKDSTPALRAAAARILISPWLSEKALISTDKGVYVFAIPRSATKYDVARAIETVYKVVPRSVRIVNLPGKRVSRRGTYGTAIQARRRKAYVRLNEGDTIQLA